MNISELRATADEARTAELAAADTLDAKTRELTNAVRDWAPLATIHQLRAEVMVLAQALSAACNAHQDAMVRHYEAKHAND